MGNCNSEKTNYSRERGLNKTKTADSTSKNSNGIKNEIYSNSQLFPNSKNSEIISNLKSIIENIKYTSDSSNLYLLSPHWFGQLLEFINSNGRYQIDKTIHNKEFINNINVTSVIYELMREILKYFQIDCILKFDVSEERNLEFTQNKYLWKYVSIITQEEFKTSAHISINTKNHYEDEQDNVESTYTNLVMIPESKDEDIETHGSNAVNGVKNKKASPQKNVSNIEYYHFKNY